MGLLRNLITRKRRHTPELDAATTGITFIDILFALAIGVDLDPIQRWASNSHENPLPAARLVGLILVLSLILGSFIGYHNSVNRPRFRIRFVNIAFVKFTLDILMVVLYFVAASFASVLPPQPKALTVIVSCIFLLYLFWDFSGWYEKSASGPYKAVWDTAYERRDVQDPWIELSRKRAWPTVVCLAVATVITIIVWLDASTQPQADELSFRAIALVYGSLIAMAFFYRVWKDWFRRT